MNIIKKIAINSDMDVALARLKTREIAKAMGFGTIDQARISLAAGELARVIAGSINRQGEIVISSADTNGQVGIQVVSINSETEKVQTNMTTQNDSAEKLVDVLSLVDEYLIEDQGQIGTRVTLMKWLS